MSAAREGAQTKPYYSRISGGVVVLSPSEPPNGWDNVEAFYVDVAGAKRLADAAPDLLAALDAARIEFRNGQTELEFARDTRRAKNDRERMVALLDSTDRVVRAHEKAIEAIDAAIAAAKGTK